MATRKVAISLYKSTEYRLQSAEYKANQILPRRRGSGSDAVADEGVETRGKAKSRKKKAEIAKRKIAYCCFVNSLRKSICFFSSLFKAGQLFLLIQYPDKTHGTAIHTQRRTTILPCCSIHQTFSEKDRHRKG